MPSTITSSGFCLNEELVIRRAWVSVDAHLWSKEFFSCLFLKFHLHYRLPGLALPPSFHQHPDGHTLCCRWVPGDSTSSHACSALPWFPDHTRSHQLLRDVGALSYNHRHNRTRQPCLLAGELGSITFQVLLLPNALRPFRARLK